MSKQNSSDLLKQLKLGKATEYTNQYDAGLLQAVPRAITRETLPNPSAKFIGQDIWTGFEISWLEQQGKPVVRIAEFIFQANSSNLVESKSFKLYLNSFNQTHFANDDAVKQQMQADLSAISGQDVLVNFYTMDEYTAKGITSLPGILLDDLPLQITQYEYNPDLLEFAQPEQQVSERLVSHLLKSNCLVTGQPDWGSIFIQYSGKKIDHARLLTYLIGFRNHNEFHEHCVERIYSDLTAKFKPDSLLVYARYTRRGGLDINPIRVSDDQLLKSMSWHRLVRQ